MNSTTGASAKTYTLKYTDKDGVEKTLTGNYAGTINASESYNAKAGTNNGTAYLSVDYAAAIEKACNLFCLLGAQTNSWSDEHLSSL